MPKQSQKKPWNIGELSGCFHFFFPSRKEKEVCVNIAVMLEKASKECDKSLSYPFLVTV